MGIVRIVFTLVLFLSFMLPAQAIKIGLLTDSGRAYIGASTPAEVIDVRTNKTSVHTRNYIIWYSIISKSNPLGVNICSYYID